MLFVYSPVVKPCEPPAGIAQLAALLKAHGIQCSVLDANLDGLLHLMQSGTHEKDRWSLRAFRNVSRNLADLRDIKIYGNFDRYKRAVADLTRVLEKGEIPQIPGRGAPGFLRTASPAEKDPALTGIPLGRPRISLSNYQDAVLSPVRSRDLLWAAEHPEGNPFFGYFSERLRGIIERTHPDTVGFSLNFLSQALCTFAMLGFLKRQYPRIRLLVGGGLATSWLRRPGWRDPFGGLVDRFVAGPGEEVLLSLLKSDPPEESEQGAERSLKTGVQTDAGGNGHAPARPDYSGFPVGRYLSPGFILPYSASIGCYWNRCSFCPERAEGNPYAPIPASIVVEHLRELAGIGPPVLIHFLDNAISPVLLETLCASPPGVPWYGFVRMTRHLADPEFCRALKRSGCVMLKLGIESGDQRVLDREEKGMDLGLASKALKVLHDAGIGTYVYLLFGTPSETLEAARKTLDFTVRHGPYIDFLNLAVFNMPIHGPETEYLQTSLLYEGDLALYTGFRHPEGWDRGLVKQFLHKEFKRHPVVAGILSTDPPQFTSNHAPLLLKREGR